MSGFAIRPSTSGDEAAVTALLDLSYRTLMPAGYDQALLDDLLPLITRANPRLLSSGTYYLAESEEGDIIGAGGWTRDQPGTGDMIAEIGHIRHFATHPDWTSRAIGRSIFERCEAEARSSAVIRFECYSSLNAVDFYAKLGFKALRRVVIPMGGELVLPAMLMERIL